MFSGDVGPPQSKMLGCSQMLPPGFDDAFLQELRAEDELGLVI